MLILRSRFVAAAARDVLLELVGLFGPTLAERKTPAPSRASQSPSSRITSKPPSPRTSSSLSSRSPMPRGYAVATIRKPQGGSLSGAPLSGAVLRGLASVRSSEAVRRDLSWWSSLRARRALRRPARMTLPPPVLVYTDVEGNGGANGALLGPSARGWWARDLRCLRRLLVPRPMQTNVYELATILVAHHTWG